MIIRHRHHLDKSCLKRRCSFLSVVRLNTTLQESILKPKVKSTYSKNQIYVY